MSHNRRRPSAAIEKSPSGSRDKPMLLTLLFAGLRASEVRGLTWRNINLKAGAITVDRRADFKNAIGPPKSKAGFRTIPVPGILVAELKRWNLRCPPCDLDLVFPSRAATPIFSHEPHHLVPRAAAEAGEDGTLFTL